MAGYERTPGDASATSVTIGTAFLNVKDYGAVADGAIAGTGTDNSAAIQAAVNAAIAAGGGTVWFPPGIYAFGTPIDFQSKQGIAFAGPMVRKSNNANTGTTLVYTGTGTSAALNAVSTRGVQFRGLAFTYSSSSFTGAFINLDQSGTPATSMGSIIDCFFSTNSNGTLQTAACWVSLANAIVQTIERNNFYYGADTAIRGRVVSGDFSNVISVRDNHFRGMTTQAIKGLGQTWLIEGNTFEPLSGGAAGGITADLGSAFGVVVHGNWFGDATASGVLVTVRGGGWSISGNTFASGATAILVKTGTRGVTITGNEASLVTTFLDVSDTPAPIRVVSFGNFVDVGTVTPLSGTPGEGSFVYNETGTTFTLYGPLAIPTASQPASLHNIGADPERWRVEIDVFPTAKANQTYDTTLTASTTMYGGFKVNSVGQNDYIEWDISLSAGTWKMELMYQKLSSGGIYSITIDGAAPTSFGGSADTIDSYAAGSTQDNRTAVTGIVIPTSGKHTVRLTMATKNGSSSGYLGRLQHVSLQRTA